MEEQKTIEVLHVEDNSDDAAMAVATLRRAEETSIRMTRVALLGDALQMLRQRPFQVILTDLNLPDCEGITAVTRLVNACRQAPVVVLSQIVDQRVGIEVLRAGAVDYLLKSEADGAQLARRIRLAIERKNIASQLERRARHDPLTDLPNRAYFFEMLEQAIDRARRTRLLFAVVFIDLDHFKAVNDELGHGAGDVVLRDAANWMRTVTRNSDFIARIAGDEFALLAESLSSHKDLEPVLNRLVSFSCKPIQWRPQFAVTLSAGVAFYPEDAADPNLLLSAADKAMYDAKRGGRACYRLSGSENQPASVIPALRLVDKNHRS